MQILGEAAPLLVRSLDYRMTRQGVLAGNLVNVDTPGYRRADIRFDALLDQADAGLRRTDARHLPGPGKEAHYRTERGPRGTRPDGNGVDLDRELIRMSRNAGAFGDQAAVLTRLIGLSRMAISGQPA